MDAREDARFRLRLAEGFLAEAEQDLSLGRWRSCVDNSQLAIENAAKSVIAQRGPVGRTHSPTTYLRALLAAEKLPPGSGAQVERLAVLADAFGRDLHMASDYGDEAARLTPWELFDEPFARQTLSGARESVDLAREIQRAINT